MFLLATVTNSIAAISVTGLTIKDIDEIPARVYGRNCPIMYPEPLDFSPTIEYVKNTFGRTTTVKWTMHYDITYTLLYAAIGSGRGMEKYAPLVAMGCLVFDKITESHPITGASLVVPGGWSIPGPMYDPTGPTADGSAELFYGMKLTFHVTELNG